MKQVRGQHIAIFIAILASSLQTGFQELYQANSFESYFGNFTGIAIGFCLSWPIGNKLGRKSGLIWSNLYVPAAIILQFLSAIFKDLKPLYWTFVKLQAGTAFGLNLLYIFEISPRHSRGKAITSYFLILKVTSFLINLTAESSEIWKYGREEVPLWALYFSLIPSAIHIIALFFCPESPAYNTVQEDDVGRAQFELERMDQSSQISADIQTKLVHTSPMTLSVLLVSLSSLLRFWMAGYLCLDNQMIEDRIFAPLWISDGVTILFTLISLGIVDRVGRKSFLFSSLAVIVTINITLVMIILAMVMIRMRLNEAPEWPASLKVLISLLICVGYSLTIVGPWMISFCNILEVGDQKTRARRLVLSHVNAALIFLTVIFVWIVVYVVISEKFGENAYKILIQYFIDFLLVFFSTTFLLVGIIWKKMPETGDESVEEISQESVDEN